MTNAWDEQKKGLEEQYFHRKEQEQLAKTRQCEREEDQKQLEAATKMRCPKCGEKLEEIVFQEIQVDRCLACHGVWLDSGELEQVTARETQGWLAHFWRGSKGH
jgi:uncharacterized protein